MSALHRLSVREMAAGLRRGDFSSVELTAAFLDRIERLDPALNAFITVTGDRALEAAALADRRLAGGAATALTGIPVAHKDIFCTEGIRTSCASRMLDSFVAPYDAGVVERVDAAGAVVLGKTNMDEFAMGSSTEASWYGPARNPWDPQRVPGGSSGGSAAAVAAAMAPVATGTDTGGSVRQPASFCGLTGIKPTYGRVSRYGMVAYASSLDQGGAMGRSAEDTAYLLQAMAGFDHRDSTSVDREVEPYPESLDVDLRGVRIGLPREYLVEGLDPEVGATVEAAMDEYHRLGATITEISLPHAALAIPAYYVVALAECSSNLARYDGVRYGHRAESPSDLRDLYERSRSEGFGPEVRRRILVGTYTLSAGYYDAYYLKAQKLRRLISADFRQAFETVDVVAGPTAPTVAFPLGEKSADPVTMYLCDVYTVAVNLAGLPALSAPAGLASGLPVGVQLIGDYFAEPRLLALAHAFQRETDWHLRVAPGFE